MEAHTPKRLKANEQNLLGWTAKRELSKINYRIHTDAIKSHLIPEEVTKEQANIIYAEEADVLNVAMFGMTAKQWREANPELKGNRSENRPPIYPIYRLTNLATGNYYPHIHPLNGKLHWITPPLVIL